MRHLLMVHKINTDNQEKAPSQDNDSPQSSKITYFMENRSFPATVAILAALDGISIRAITRSSFIRSSFERLNMHLPKNENIILKYYESVAAKTKREILSGISQRKSHSLVLDEWSSISQKKKYLNIYLHGSETFYNLDLVPINGSCKASEIRKIVENKLEDYQISYENDIVATISDGPNVMKRFVADSPAEGILCWNHVIHLAFLETMFEKCRIRRK